MKRILHLTYSLLLICWSIEIQAQQYSFIQYNVREGLVQSQVRCLFQDSRGFIWAGTLGGLSRFDGRKFVNFDRSNGLPGNQINCIHELEDGAIVAGFNGSIALVYGNTIETISLGSSWKDATVNCIWGQRKSELYVGTEAGIFILRAGQVQGPIAPKIDDGTHIKNIIDHQGKKLIVSKGGITSLEGERFVEYFIPPMGVTLFDAISSADTLWIGTKDMGLLKYVDNRIQSFGPGQGLHSTTITSVIQDSFKTLWLSSRFGLYQFDGTHFQSFDETNGLPTNDVRDILEDREGNIWVATYGSGLLRFVGENILSYTTKDGLSSNAVMSVSPDLADGFWISTYDQGICRLTNDTIIAYPLSELTDNNRIWTSISTISGDTWFGSADGLFRYRKGKFQHFGEKDGLLDRMVLSLLETEDGILWIGTAKGLGSYHDGIFSAVAGTPKTRIRSISLDHKNHLWLASLEGVFEYDGIEFKNYSEQDGLPEKSTYCIEVDAFDHIWVGTQNGLGIWRNGLFEMINVDDVAGSNTINFLQSHERDLWIGTNNGLYRVSLTQTISLDKISFEHFGLKEGLRSLETNLNSGYIDQSGNLWFGTTDGLMKFLTKTHPLQHTRVPPQVNLTSIKLNLQDVDWNQLENVHIDSLSGLPKGLKVDHKHNHFTFHFTGISHTKPDELLYQYMLEGFDEDWQALTNTGSATYSNLPYDQFSFKLRALSAQGIWSDTLTYNFEIEPPYWYTWWFIALEILAGLGLFWIIFQSRRKSLITKHEKEKFEMRSKMLTLEQESLNSSMNRHFIFNALNSIQYYINRQDRISANRYLSDFARLIRKNLDSSNDNLTTLRDEMERLELYLRLEHMRFKDKFEYSIHVDEDLDQDDIKVPAMLLQPFLENSIWHGILPKNSPGRIDIGVSRKGESIEFTITDDGIGIENSLKNKSGTDTHISKGMAITSGRIDLIKLMTSQHLELQGPEQLHDAEGRPSGTMVKVILPVNFTELFTN